MPIPSLDAACPLAVFVPELGARSETFIRRHVQSLLPGRTLVIGGRLSDRSARDWDTQGPLVDLGGVTDPKTVQRWLREYGVQVCLGEYLDASLPWLSVAQELGLPFFAHAHGYDVSLRLREPQYQVEYLRYRNGAGVITMSEVSRRRLIDFGLPGERVHAIPYGVDVPERFTERERATPVRLLAVGRMVAKKAPVLTLDAFRRARDGGAAMRLDYVGSGPLLSSARHFVAALGLEDAIALLEGQTNKAVHTLMQAADIFVQHSVCDPDTGDEEGLPVSILEAMARGLPVVATRHAGIPEAVEDGVTGFLVEEGDSAGMARRIQQLACDHSLRIAMGRAAWECARTHFDWTLERQRLKSLLQLPD
jgi:glycosyltransferase involved in cell wall biosynthesis